MKETKKFDEVLIDILDDVMEDILQINPDDSVDVESDDADPDDDESNELLDELYSEVDFLLEILSLMTNITKGILAHCNDTIAEIAELEEE